MMFVLKCIHELSARFFISSFERCGCRSSFDIVASAPRKIMPSPRSLNTCATLVWMCRLLIVRKKLIPT